MNATRLLDAVEQRAHDYSGGDAEARRSYLIGALGQQVRTLCADIEQLRSPAGIADSIARLPAHVDAQRTVFIALRDQADELESSGEYSGFDTVCACLDEALCALGECTLVQPEEEPIEQPKAIPEHLRRPEGSP